MQQPVFGMYISWKIKLMCRNFSRNIPTGQSTKKYVYHKPSNRIARLVNQYGADVEKITVFIELLSKYKS